MAYEKVHARIPAPPIKVLTHVGVVIGQAEEHGRQVARETASVETMPAGARKLFKEKALQVRHSARVP